MSIKIPFPDFENAISPEMLERAKAYYEYGHILNLELIDENEWVAEVEGAEIYNTYIKFDGKYIEHQCSCPYDWGGVCKHVVAVLCNIREIEGKLSVSSAGKTLKKTIEELSETELRKFVFDSAKQNLDFRQALLDEFGKA